MTPVSEGARNMPMHVSLMHKKDPQRGLIFVHQTPSLSFVLSWLRLSVEYKYYLEG